MDISFLFQYLQTLRTLSSEVHKPQDRFKNINFTGYLAGWSAVHANSMLAQYIFSNETVPGVNYKQRLDLLVRLEA